MPDRVAEQLGTFLCSACGAVAPDSVWNDMEEPVGNNNDDEDEKKPRKVTVTCPACRGSGWKDRKAGVKCGGGCNGTGKITATI